MKSGVLTLLICIFQQVKNAIIALFLDLYDRSIVASITSNKINSKLAIDTLKMALKSIKKGDKIILHSDQGSQYTSKSFTGF